MRRSMWAMGVVVLLAWAASAGEARGREQSAVILGKLCFPSEWIPPMTVYAREVHTGRTFTVRTRTDQRIYRIRVAAPGTYVVFSRVSREDTGADRVWDALYSRAVPCGLRVDCLNSRPIPVAVRPGQWRKGVHVCDYESAWTPGLFERPGGSRATLPGSDLRSLEEVKAAWRRLPGIRTYRARVWIPEEVVFEVERQGHGHAVRVVRVMDILRGRRVEATLRWEHVRIGPHAWESEVYRSGDRNESVCRKVHPDEVPFPPSLFPEPGFPAVEEVVSVRRVGDRAVAGGTGLVSVYEWRSRLAMVRGWQVGGVLHVDRASGLPVWMTFEPVWMTFEAERQRFTAEYYDFNAPFRVRKPAGC